MNIYSKTFNDIQKVRIALHLCIKCAESLPENSTILECEDRNKCLQRVKNIKRIKHKIKGVDKLPPKNNEFKPEPPKIKLCKTCNSPTNDGLYCSNCKANTIKCNKEKLNKTIESNKNFFLQLEINQAIKTENYMGFNISRIRKLKKMSRQKLSKITNFTVLNIVNIESGDKQISLSQFVAKALEINPSMFDINADEMYGKLYLHFKRKIMNFDSIK